MKYDYKDERGYKSITRQDVDLILRCSRWAMETIGMKPDGTLINALRQRNPSDYLEKRDSNWEISRSELITKIIQELTVVVNTELMYDFYLLDLSRKLFGDYGNSTKLPDKIRDKIHRQLSHYWAGSTMENYCMLLVHLEVDKSLDVMEGYMMWNFDVKAGLVSLGAEYMSCVLQDHETQQIKEQREADDLPF